MKIGDKKDINMFHGEIKIKISTFAKETHITLAIWRELTILKEKRARCSSQCIILAHVLPVCNSHQKAHRLTLVSLSKIKTLVEYDWVQNGIN